MLHVTNVDSARELMERSGVPGSVIVWPDVLHEGPTPLLAGDEWNQLRSRYLASHAFAGAGVPGGQIIGRTDRDGGYVLEKPYLPEDYAATLYEKLGIDRTRPLSTPSNRPVHIAHHGKVMDELF